MENKLSLKNAGINVVYFRPEELSVFSKNGVSASKGILYSCLSLEFTHKYNNTSLHYPTTRPA